MVMSSRIMLWRRLLCYVVLTGLLLPFQALFLVLRLPLAATLPLLYHGLCARLLGFRVRVSGEALTGGPVLYVSNHVSYFDIIVLGSLLRGSFVAKSELKGWPVFGMLARLQRTLFIERRRARSGVHVRAIAERLRDGGRLILFPEGTSNDGNRTLPFRSAMFAAVAAGRRGATAPPGAPVRIQPVSIAYTRLNGIPMGRGLRPFYAWYGDMHLLPHLCDALSLGQVDVEVEFHPPVDPAAFADRKALAVHCRKTVSRGVSRALSGRPRIPSGPARDAAP